jgi:hypothetical protein
MQTTSTDIATNTVKWLSWMPSRTWDWASDAAHALALMPSPRRFPPPWSVEDLDACFVVRDHAGQKLAYVYFEDQPGRAIGGEATHEGWGAADRGEYRQAAEFARAQLVPNSSGNQIRAASSVPSCSGTSVCSMIRTALGNVVTITATNCSND